jgi:CRP-like cAMP-binding protein
LKRPNRSKADAKKAFDAHEFLDSAGVAQKVAEFKKKETNLSQGDPCRNVFYIQKGGVRLSVVNESGKEAVVAVLRPGISLARDAWPVSRLGWGRQPPSRQPPR